MSEQKDPIIKRKINYENFNLLKAKLKEYGADFHWIERGTSGGRHMYELKEIPHESLNESLEALSPYFAARIGIESGVNKVEEIAKKSKDLLLIEKIMDIKVKEVERCEVSGISISGEGPLHGVTITGQVKVPIYGSYALGAPKINLQSDKLGYEEEIKEMCEEVRKAAYNILFLGAKGPLKKKTQLDLG